MANYASKIPYILFNFITFHDWTYDLVTTVRSNGPFGTGRAISILPSYEGLKLKLPCRAIAPEWL